MKKSGFILGIAFLTGVLLIFAPYSMYAKGAKEVQKSEIKNVILLIPDGMSIDSVTLARGVQGGALLAMDSMACGLVRQCRFSHRGFRILGASPCSETIPAQIEQGSSDPANPVFVVKAKKKELRLPVNKNYGMLNGNPLKLDGVTVYISETKSWYINSKVAELLK